MFLGVYIKQNFFHKLKEFKVIIKSLFPKQQEKFILDKTYFLFKELVLFFQTGNFPNEIKKDWENRTGGGLCMFGRGKYDVVLWAEVGFVPPEKENKYLFFSREKGERLFSHLSEGHLTSHESQNLEKNEFGGAIFTNGDKRYSFSGLPEVKYRGDSVLMLTLAIVMQDIHYLEALKISKDILKTDNFQNFCQFINERHMGFFP